jgi:hypothetical protein
MTKRGTIVASGVLTAALALAGCGEVSVGAGGENAATHPASGIWESNTVGGGDVSGHALPSVPLTLPPSTPPLSLPSGLNAAETALESAVTGGCWQNAHAGDVYGAWDQLFWWQGQCGDTLGQVTIEVFSSAGAATGSSHHRTSTALQARFLDGALLIDVWANAPSSVVAQVASVKGAKAVPGYGS